MKHHLRSLNRALTHPTRGRLGGGTRHPGPSVGHRGENTTTDPSSPPSATGATGDAAPHGRHPGGPVLLAVAWGTAVAGAVAGLLTNSSVGHRLVLASGLLAVAGLLVQRPHLADRALAALVGTVLLPIFLLIGLAVAVTSPGPTLVREVRVDPTGRPAPALRFRTTVLEASPSSEARRDAPPTAVGRILRPLYLDELPRLLDVLWGNVPLVPSRRH